MNPIRPFFLLTNDDGIDAPGMAALRRAVAPVADALAVAPLVEQSGQGHAVSLRKDLLVEPRGPHESPWGWAVNGTPSDCVKMGFTRLLDRRPDLVVSGINAGINVGNSIYYSGTVAGAVEGVLFDCPAVALSMHTVGRREPNWDTGSRVAEQVLRWVLRHPLPRRTVLNVNIPTIPYEDLKGFRTTCQGTSLYVDEYAETASGDGKRVFRNVGEKLIVSPEPGDADDLAVLEGYVSITPLRLDMTDAAWRQLVSEEIEFLNRDAGFGAAERKDPPRHDPTAAVPGE